MLGRIGDYPEVFNAARHYPDGRLFNYQRTKVRLWSIYNADLGRFGDASISASGANRLGQVLQPASRRGQPITATQRALLRPPVIRTSLPIRRCSSASAARRPSTATASAIWAVGYNIPVFKTLRPWLKFDVYNVLNNQKQIAWNTTVSQDPTSPLDSLGLRTGYRARRELRTRATANTHFPIPVPGRDRRPHVPRRRAASGSTRAFSTISSRTR